MEFSRIVLWLILLNIVNDHPGTKSGSVVMQFADEKCKKILQYRGE